MVYTNLMNILLVSASAYLTVHVSEAASIQEKSCPDISGVYETEYTFYSYDMAGNTVSQGGDMAETTIIQTGCFVEVSSKFKFLDDTFDSEAWMGTSKNGGILAYDGSVFKAFLNSIEAALPEGSIQAENSIKVLTVAEEQDGTLYFQSTENLGDEKIVGYGAHYHKKSV